MQTLLKDPIKREQLRERFGAKAVEMETAGLADAAWMNEIGYLGVRGICDYCDANKNDVWQDYAAMAAAGYVRALLMSMPGAFSATSGLSSGKDDSSPPVDLPNNSWVSQTSSHPARPLDRPEPKNLDATELDRETITRDPVPYTPRKARNRLGAWKRPIVPGILGLCGFTLLALASYSQYTRWIDLNYKTNRASLDLSAQPDQSSENGKGEKAISNQLVPSKELTKEEVSNVHVWKDCNRILKDHGLLHYFEDASLEELPDILIYNEPDFTGARMLVPQGVESDVAWTGNLMMGAGGEVHSLIPNRRMIEIRSVESKLAWKWSCIISPTDLPTQGVQFGPGLRLTSQDSQIADCKRRYQGPKLTRVEWRPVYSADRQAMVEPLLLKLKSGTPLEQRAASLAILCQGPKIEDVKMRRQIADELFRHLQNGPDKSMMEIVAISAAILDPNHAVDRLSQLAAHHVSEFRQADATTAIALLDPITPELVARFQDVLANARIRARSVLLHELGNQGRALNFSGEDASLMFGLVMRGVLQSDLDQGCRASAAIVIEKIGQSTTGELSEINVRAIRQVLERNSITVFERNMLEGVLNRFQRVQKSAVGLGETRAAAP